MSTQQGSIPRFFALDGIRGVAALIVALFHFKSGFTSYTNYPAGDGYLAVDLFFMLSGFILAFGYSAKFDRGMTSIEFMKIRLIRLYPLYLLALTWATIMLIFGSDSPPNISTGEITKIYIQEVFFLPAKSSINDAFFTINGAAWSLFFELVANFLFVTFWRKLNNRNLYRILIASAVALAACTIYLKSASVGTHWNNWFAGIPRVVFSFFAGILIYRWHQSGKYKIKSGAAAFIASVLLLFGYLSLPIDSSYRAYFDLVFIFFIGPTIVHACANIALPSKLVWPATFLGNTSYALYATHGSIVYIVKDLTIKFLPGMDFILISCFAIAVLLGICHLLDIYYDTPARRILNKYFKASKIPEQSHVSTK